MNELQTDVPATMVSSDARLRTQRAAPAGLWTALVVSPSPHRSQLLVRAAQQEHWATIVCRTADEAARQAVRNRIHLALVDLQSVHKEQERDYRAMVEQLAARDGPLLAICGRPNDAIGEVWSRQLGVWMYLPGIDSECDVALVCCEARSIVEKLHGKSPEHAR